MTPKSIFLHVGAHKTATTAIQAALSSADPAFILPSRYRVSEFDAAYRGDVERDWAELFLSEFDVGDSEDIRISEERLLGPPFESGGFYSRSNRLISLIKGLKLRGLEVNVFLCVRQHLDFLKSWYLQAAGAGLAFGSLLDYADHYEIKTFSWDAVATSLKATGCNLNITTYDLLLEDRSEFVSAFNGFFKGPYLTEASLDARYNPSIDHRGLEIIRGMTGIKRSSLRSQAARIIREAFASEHRPVLLPAVFEDAMAAASARLDAKFARKHLSGPSRETWLRKRAKPTTGGGKAS